MAYSKSELNKALVNILSLKSVNSLGTTRSVEEAAIQLFLNDDAHQEAVSIIKEALSDLRDFGRLIYLPEPQSEWR